MVEKYVQGEIFMTQHGSKTEWMSVVTVEKTVTINETETRAAVDITGYGMADAIEIMQAFLKATEDEIAAS